MCYSASVLSTLCLQELVLDLIGPDVQALIPAPSTSQAGVLPAQHLGRGTSTHAVHEIRPEVCKGCRQQERSILVRVHACGYEAAAPSLADDPDIVCMFHPGLAADQPQSIEGAATLPADHRARGASGAIGRKRKRMHRLQGNSCASQAGARSRPGLHQDTVEAERKNNKERLRPPLAARPAGSCGTDSGGELSYREQEMPSLKQAWVACYPHLASLTCPLLVTAFSMAGVPLHAKHVGQRPPLTSSQHRAGYVPEPMSCCNIAAQSCMNQCMASAA